jgi:hypothetical protein
MKLKLHKFTCNFLAESKKLLYTALHDSQFDFGFDTIDTVISVSAKAKKLIRTFCKTVNEFFCHNRNAGKKLRLIFEVDSQNINFD